MKCTIDPRVREAFIFVIGHSGQIMKEKAESFDLIYNTAKRILDPEGKLLAEIRKEAYMLVEKLFITVKEVHKEAAARGLEKRISINSIAPEIDVKRLLFDPTLCRDIVITGAFNYKEMIDREMNKLKIKLKEQGINREKRDLMISEARYKEINNISWAMNSCGDVFSGAFLRIPMQASFYRNGNPLQQLIVEIENIFFGLRLPYHDAHHALACIRTNPHCFSSTS